MVSIKRILREELNKFVISEGLISSYPIEKVKSYIEKKLPSADVSISDKMYTNVLHMVVVNDGYNVDKLLVNVDNLCGWYSSVINGLQTNQYYSSVLSAFKDGNEKVAIVLERRFDKDVDNANDKAYHLTDAKYVPKILKIGLVPKTRNRKWKYPERIYLSRTKMGLYSLFDNPEFNEFEQPVALEVDLKGLDIKLYRDPNFNGGFYTLDNIPPSHIKVVEL